MREIIKSFQIDGHQIGDNAPPFIVAELSGNHNGKIENAFKLIEQAKECGANAVKLQTYTADTLTINHDSEEFRISDGRWKGYTLYELYEWAHTPWEWHEELFECAKKTGITLFSSPFDSTAIELLESLNCPAYKIASFEIIDHELITNAAATGKPLIISTGLASSDEIEEAVETARNANCTELALLHCVSSYPAETSDYNIKSIENLSRDYDVVSGVSDHSTGNIVSVSSVVLGGAIIEKHFTLDRSDGGPDAGFSIEPEELKQLCIDCKAAWSSLRENEQNKNSEQSSLIFRRSLFVVNDIRQGDKFTRDNVRSIRPGYGMPPKYIQHILGKTASRDIKRGEPINETMLASE